MLKIKFEQLLGFRNVNARTAKHGIERSGAAKVGTKPQIFCKIPPRQSA